jgi:hypothetical protein
MRLLLILIMLGLTSLTLAADNAPQQTTPPAPDDEEILQAAPIETPANSEPGTDLILADIDADAQSQEEDEQGNRRFIPTEEISQDLGVSFPIDI